MRDFSKFSSAFWHSKAIRALSDDGRYFQVYAITNGHQTACGCFALPDGYAISDLQWPTERLQVARAEVVDAGLVLFNAVTSELLVTKWFRHNLAMNPSHRKAIIRAIEAIASNELRAAAWQELAAAEAAAQSRQDAKAMTASAVTKSVSTALLQKIAGGR
jgi:hypothetical protein